jgi:osmoprotectant transport system ATP-binding protein
MLLDEPFGALDPIIRDGVRQAFAAIRERGKLTAVMVTHDMTEALTMADRIAVMREGELVAHGTPRDLLTRPQKDYVTTLIRGPLEETRQVERLLAGGAP